MYFIMYSLLLLLSSLLHITTCTVYTVTPDDHYYPNTTCHHCHNLQHYLLNSTKYFTSNTQLLFLPGIYDLDIDLILQNIHNISLIGSTTNGTLDTLIQLQTCTKCISITNVTKLTIRSIIFNDNPHYLKKLALLYIHNCSFVLLNHLIIDQQYAFNYNALLAINIMGNSLLNHVTCFGGIQVVYNEAHTDRVHHSLSINNCTVHTMYLDMLQISYKVTLTIINIQAQDSLFSYKSIIHAEELGTNEVLIIDCYFVSDTNHISQLLLFSSTCNGSVQFTNCRFINNVILEVPDAQTTLVRLNGSIQAEFNNCDFYGNKILESYGRSVNPINVVVRSTVYNYTTAMLRATQNTSVLLLSHTTLILADSVSFQNITGVYSIISLTGNSTIVISGTVKLSHNVAHVLINLYNSNKQYIIIKENSILNISHNEAWLLFKTNLPISKYPFSYCFFQYFTNHSSTGKQVEMEKRDFLIRFKDNQYFGNPNYYNSTPTTNCLWLENSFDNNNMIPLEVNNHYMQFISNSGTYKLSQLIEQSTLCVCTNESHNDRDHDCHINDFGYSYPGQTLTISLYHRVAATANVVVKTDIYQRYVTPCIVLNISENLQYINEQCVRLHYTIGFPTDNWCELFLKIASDSDDYLNIFYVRQITCPTGFVKIDKRCQCDPVFIQYGITYCNINDQTILRPANNWISATTHNNSYTYHISLHCPFHYCLPHSSHHDFSTPNSQCQFNRSGILCGHCQQGLSTIFSSPHCQNCSSVFLLLIIPIAVVGVILVLLLFALNLTVTDGTINGFILYVNVISINTPMFFTELNHFTPTYTFISIANLDLGIQTCFYNGMDDFAKMWLQLAFPFYLIFIATLIIITSRYSTTIQRLTARRALPVLATLFLLSYTKILRIVSSVLFFYSTITHLPSKHTTLVWSVDANVPLFGVRFTILFIVCLILFLILVPFNVILLFTRTLSRFRFINKFKPLLEAYQGPYKDKYYYWTGLQLLLRAVVFEISSLDRNINFTVSIILFGIIGVIQAALHPFKINYKNYQELILAMNLQALYAISLYSQDVTNTTAVNIMITMAAVHFIFIITYHMITYARGGVIRNKIQLSLNTFTGWITRLHRKSQPQQFQLEDKIHDNIPEVTFNYREYREPLVGQDL